MIKDRKCQYYRRCRLTRECQGCVIPAKANEYEYEQTLKMQYSSDPDKRGYTMRSETYGRIINNKEDLYDDEHGEGEQVEH